MGKVKGTTKSGGQKHSLDKFYTSLPIAKYCIDKVSIEDYNTIIEPSAGSGAFSNQIADCIAMDIHPEHSNIIKQDWLTYKHIKAPSEKVLVIGNPPFGQQNSLAIEFINKASEFADRVAFVLPISFKKQSIQNRLDPYLHLVYEEVLPNNSFLLKGEVYDVKCVFQIWDKQDIPRDKPSRKELNTNNLFSFVKKLDNPDIAIQRIGGNAGKAFAIPENRNESSHYFAKFHKKVSKEEKTRIVSRLNKLVYDSRDYAVGPRSLSKQEINVEINTIF